MELSDHSGEHPNLVPDYKGKTLNFFTTEYDSCGFVTYGLSC
jgi:hypothetical protein